jgi:hypothetical protein
MFISPLSSWDKLHVELENLKQLECAVIQVYSNFVYVLIQFMRDASEVMDMLLKAQTGDLQDDDPQTSYLISAWARICKILGQSTGLEYSTTLHKMHA